MTTTAKTTKAATTKAPVAFELPFTPVLQWPEVCSIALPGEEIDGIVAAPQHYLVKMWPLMRPASPGSYLKWQLVAPCVYDIDTTAPPDPNKTGFDGYSNRQDHWARPVRLVSPLDGAGHPFAATKWYVSQGEFTVEDGFLCRGDAIFPSAAFQCATTLRLWALQTLGNGTGHKLNPAETQRTWWKQHKDEFFARHAVPMVTVVAAVEIKTLMAAYTTRLTPEIVDAFINDVACPVVK